MSRKREGLVDLLHWSRRPSTCDQTGPRKERDERPNTGSIHGSTNGSSSLRRQSSHVAAVNRGALPPLSRNGSILYGSGSTAPGGSISPEPPTETLSHFQEALYVKGQPHNATSRLLRLGAGSPLRRSGTSSGPSAIPPLPTPPPRTQSATLSASGMAAASPESSGGSGNFVPPYMEILAVRQSQPLPLPLTQQQLLLQPGSQQQPPPSPQVGPLTGSLRPSTAWSASLSGSPPRTFQRFAGKDHGALLEEARRKAQEAMEVLCGNQEISAETRAQAIAALQDLEALLGPRELNLTALVTAAKNLKSDLCKELHNTEKQGAFARVQIKSLERQHDLLRHQLRARPEPIVPPPPVVGVAGLSDAGTPGVSPKQCSNCDVLMLTRNGSGSFSAPHSPMSQSKQRLDGGPPRAPRPGYYAAAAAAIASGSGDGSVDGGEAAAASEGGNDGSIGGFGGAISAAAAMQPAMTSSLAMMSSPSFADRSGGVESAGGGPVLLSDKWSLAGAMTRTLHIRAIQRVEVALQAVAAEKAALERPHSSGAADAAPPVDVEELRRLKHTPQGIAENLANTPSYLGVSVRRAPSPGPATAAAAADPRLTLQWSNRGISTAKMPQLKEALATAPQLLRLCLAGNKLANEDVMELMGILSEPSAPRIQDLILDQNTNLSWRCALPLALALGMSPDMAATSAAADWAAVAAALPPSSTPATLLAPAAVLLSARDKIRRLLDLRVLSLSGVKLGDKGVSQLAEGLRANNALLELHLRRCGISDAGGAVLMDVLESNGRLQRLDVSWNALRAESARVLEAALAGNAGLRELSLANNGFNDLDGARIIKGLLSHGRWLHVDLSHNTLGPGSCMMVGELLRRLGAAAASLMVQGTYAESWPRRGSSINGGGSSLQQHQQHGSGAVEAGTPAGSAPLTQTPGSKGVGGLTNEGSKRFVALPEERSAPPSPTSLRISAGQLGSQLHKGQPVLALDGNPLGSTGLRIILDAMDGMSHSLMTTAGFQPLDPTVLEDLWGSPGVPPLPLHVSITGCNVAPPSERGGDSNDDANPFLPSIAVLCIPPPGSGVGGRPGPAKKPPAAAATAGTGSKATPAKEGPSRDRPATRGGPGSGGGSSQAVPHAALTLQSPHLDLQSPAGVYCLDLAHPATAVLVSYLLRLRERMNAAAAAGLLAAGVTVAIAGISINGKQTKLDKLSSVENWSEGTLQLTVKAPAVLALEAPLPLTPPVASWLASLLDDPTTSPLWKLSVIQAAGAVCLFTPGQCLALLAGFDRDTQATEAVAAAQMLYARSAQPLAFWEHVLPRMSSSQQTALRERVGDLVALDMTRPMGRYTLNLSRQVDRFVALRLQLASALESSWLENKYYINWLNASFNGQTLDRPGLTHIRDYTLPGAGVLRLDYVSYKKPGLGLPPATPEELAELLRRLRACTKSHMAAQLQLRAQVAPPPPQAPLRRERLRSPIGRRKPPPPPPPPKPRLSAFQLMHTSLLDVARFLASPGTPPPPPSGGAGNDGSGGGAAPPPPPLPPTTSWTLACGFDSEPLFRRTGVPPPDWAVAESSSPLAGETGPPGTGPVPALPDGALALARTASVTAAKSARRGSIVGRNSLVAASATSMRAARRRSIRDKDEDEEEQATQADYHAALFAMVYSARDLPLLASKMGPIHLVAAVSALLRYEGGDLAAAALMAALPPLAASKFLYDQADSSPCLLPQDTRRQLLSSMPQERVRLVEAAGRGASEAALARARQVRTALNLWASRRHVSCEQVETVLSALHTEGDRVAAMVVLWPRLVDGRWKRMYLKLKLTEQRQVMMRLGFWHVYQCLGDPHGISFSLDLREPEQREIARELVRMAVKETMRAKQEARARGGLYAATLLDLHGNGNPVSIPEDEKLWGMADSNFKTMDFLYCPTFEQSLDQVAGCAVQIQRFWGAVRAKRAARIARMMAAEDSIGVPSA